MTPGLPNSKFEQVGWRFDDKKDSIQADLEQNVFLSGLLGTAIGSFLVIAMYGPLTIAKSTAGK